MRDLDQGNPRRHHSPLLHAPDPCEPAPIKLSQAGTAGHCTSLPWPAPAVRNGPREAEPVALWREEPLSPLPAPRDAFIAPSVPLARAWECAHTPQQRPPTDAADLWGPVTSQSTPCQAKPVRLPPQHTPPGSPDITATRHDRTSFTTQPRWPRPPRQAVLSLGVQAKEQSTGGFKSCSCWRQKHLGSVAQGRSHPRYQGVCRAACTSKAGYTARPSLFLPSLTASSPAWWTHCLNQHRPCVNSPFSLRINGALLGIFRRVKIKRHGTTENLKNSLCPRSGANPRNSGASAGFLVPPVLWGALLVLLPPAQAVQLPPGQPFLQPLPSGQAQPPHLRPHERAQPSPRGEADPLLPFIARKLHKFITRIAPEASPMYICFLRPGAEHGSLSKTTSPPAFAAAEGKQASKGQC